MLILMAPEHVMCLFLDLENRGFELPELEYTNLHSHFAQNERIASPMAPRIWPQRERKTNPLRMIQCLTNLDEDEINSR